MALTTRQYRVMRDQMRGLLFADTDAAMLGFFRGLYAEATGAAALSSARNTLANRIFKGLLSADGANPTDDNIPDFWAAIATDSSAATLLPTATYQTMRNEMRVLMSADGLNPTPADVLSYLSPYAFSLLGDQRLLNWYETDNGLASKAVNSKFGPLVETGGTVAAGSTLNGKPTWGYRVANGAWHQTADLGTDRAFAPYHIFTIIKDVGSVLNAGYWGTADARVELQYNNGSTMKFKGQSFSATPTNFNYLDIYVHGSKTTVSVNNGAPVTLTGAALICNLRNVILGTQLNAGQLVNADMAMWVLYEGQASQVYKQAVTDYVNTKYAMGLPAPQAQVNVDPTDPSLLLTGSFHILPINGQSNAEGLSTVATTSPNAGILYLEGGQKVAQMPDNYGVDTSRIDEISIPIPGTNMSTKFGPVGGIANAYQAVRGGQVVCAVGPKGGSAVVPQAVSPSSLWFTLSPSYPRGFKLRDAQYGSLIAQVKWLQSRGGVVRYLTHYNGEAEATAAAAIGDLWPAAAQALWAQFFIDIGMPGQDKVVFVQISPTDPGFTNWTNFRVNTQPLAQVAGKYVMVSAPAGPLEADNLHLQGTACNVLSTAIHNAAMAQGW